MRMTTKLVSLLTILFVFFKFGEPAKVMMSIYGDKSFLFHSTNLAVDTLVGFVYEDTNGAFSVANCSGTADETYFKLQTDCTVLPAAVTTTTGSTEDTLKLVTAANFPESDVSTNMMVAKIHATTPIVTKTTANIALAAAELITIVIVLIPVGSTPAAAQDPSAFLCNNLNAVESETFFAVVPGTFGQVNHVKDGAYLPMMKCVAAVRDADPVTRSAFATFVLIITDHASLDGGLSSLAFPSVVLFPQSTNQTTAATTVVGYINGLDGCSSNANVTFEKPTTTSCKGKISINTSGNYSFNYNGTAYYLPVTDATGSTTCPATTTTTCEDFALNFKYSNTLIGILLIFTLKMLQSY